MFYKVNATLTPQESQALVYFLCHEAFDQLLYLRQVQQNKACSCRCVCLLFCTYLSSPSCPISDQHLFVCLFTLLCSVWWTQGVQRHEAVLPLPQGRWHLPIGQWGQGLHARTAAIREVCLPLTLRLFSYFPFPSSFSHCPTADLHLWSKAFTFLGVGEVRGVSLCKHRMGLIWCCCSRVVLKPNYGEFGWPCLVL